MALRVPIATATTSNIEKTIRPRTIQRRNRARRGKDLSAAVAVGAFAAGFSGDMPAALSVRPAAEQAEDHRHEEEDERHLDDQARDDGDGERLLHRGALAEGKRKRQKREDGRRRCHYDRPQAVDPGVE